jgi:hypothetical protein
MSDAARKSGNYSRKPAFGFGPEDYIEVAVLFCHVRQCIVIDCSIERQFEPHKRKGA